MDASTKFSVSTVPLCNMILALLILAQIPVMFGVVSGAGTIGLVPWIACAYPVIVVCVIMMLKNGEFMDATINGILSTVLMGQNAIAGLIQLAYSVSGQQMPSEVAAGMGMINGLAFLTGGIILLCACTVAMRANKIAGACIGISGIGFISLFAMYYGAGPLFGMAGGICLTILAVFLLVTGVMAFFPKKEAQQ
ncbi:hypothetical protein [uncultured Slackia sp.]|uniref:hypothetical protein n=1 Tax=uncultured Slackia sp. TaxID=665903 RepID=UPI0026DBEB89|nr:hypothetical protein [uncultured Slackia sp.]